MDFLFYILKTNSNVVAELGRPVRRMPMETKQIMLVCAAGMSCADHGQIKCRKLQRSGGLAATIFTVEIKKQKTI